MIIALALAAVMPLQAIDTDIDPRDVPLHDRTAAIETCLAGPGARDGETCIGVIADPCQTNSHGAAGTVGAVQCHVLEREAWDALMDEWLTEASTARRMNDDSRRALTAGQAAWVQMRVQDARVIQSWDGSAWAIASALEEQQETARRALWLRDLATYANEG